MEFVTSFDASDRESHKMQVGHALKILKDMTYDDMHIGVGIFVGAPDPDPNCVDRKVTVVGVGTLPEMLAARQMLDEIIMQKIKEANAAPNHNSNTH